MSHKQPQHRLAMQTATVAFAALLSACTTSPTGRTQLRWLPADQVAQMGESAYARLRQTEPTVSGTPVSRYIECVARAITAVVPDAPAGGRWDVTVFQGEQVNAFALRGAGHDRSPMKGLTGFDRGATASSVAMGLMETLSRSHCL
jgi:predicted Zn-dependent protease